MNRKSNTPIYKFVQSFFNEKYLAIIPIIFILFVTFSFTINENMNKSTNGAMANIFSEYMGAVISNFKYGSTGYVGYKEVRNTLKNAGSSIDDDAIDSAMAIPHSSLNEIYTMASLDTGYIDYSLIAFYLFGPRVGSLLYLYISIFCISILLFFIQFGKSPLANIILILFMIAHYIAIIAIPYVDHNSGVIYNPRLIPMLGILPLIHIYLSHGQNNQSIITFILISLQSMIIVMVNHVRSPAVWMILFIIILLFLNVYKWLKKSFHETTKLNYFRNIKNNFKPIFFQKSWQLIPVLIMVLVWKIFFPLTLDQKYAADGEGSHFSSVWSAIFNGMAIHPDIREYYVGERKLKLNDKYDEVCSQERFKTKSNLKPELRKWLCKNRFLLNKLLIVQDSFLYHAKDQDGYSAAFNWLHKNGMNVYKFFNFNQFEPVKLSSSFHWFRAHPQFDFRLSNNETVRNFDWDDDFNTGKFDKIHYNIVMDVLWSHPLAVLELVFIIKPVQYLALYASSFFPRLLGFPAILVYCFGLFFIYMEKRVSFSEIMYILIPLTLMFLISVSPFMITYPGTHVMFDQVIILNMIIIGLFIFLTKKYFWKLFHKH